MTGEPDGRAESDDGALDDTASDPGASDDTAPDPESADSYCRRCGEPLARGAIAAEGRACCLNATPIAGVCPTHGPVGPHHAVDDPSVAEPE